MQILGYLREFSPRKRLHKELGGITGRTWIAFLVPNDSPQRLPTAIIKEFRLATCKFPCINEIRGLDSEQPGRAS